MKFYDGEHNITPAGNVARWAAAGAAVLAVCFGEQAIRGQNPCEPSHDATSWITAPVCDLPASALGLHASDAPQTAPQPN